jgi:microsomal epoxide hydrolase
MPIPKSASLKPQPFRLSIPDEQLEELKTLTKLSKLPPPTYEGTQPQYGVTSEWMKNARDYWLNEFDWYAFSCYAGE